MIVLFDGDVLVYRIGFSVQESFYTVDDYEFKYLKDAREFKEKMIGHTGPIEKVVKAEPVEEAYRRMDVLISRVLNELDASYEEGCLIFLTHSDPLLNFRTSVATTLKYKANRKGVAKPVHYKAIREYLFKKHKACLVYGAEADDALGIEQTKISLRHNQESIIASVDKDLLQVPGNHYNIHTRQVSVSDYGLGQLELYKNGAGDWRIRGNGFIWFCAQMLLGDAIDNIKGINRIGPKKTYDLLSKCKSKTEALKKVKKIYLDKENIDRYAENKALLWILRNRSKHYVRYTPYSEDHRHV